MMMVRAIITMSKSRSDFKVAVMTKLIMMMLRMIMMMMMMMMMITILIRSCCKLDC